MTNRKIAAEALSLLLRQSLAGRYSLSLFDVRKTVTGGRAIINSISEYEKTTGERLSSRPEGFTVKSGSLSLIFYDDRIQSRERINWTLAHELGHVCLRHTSDGKREESEANRFAAAFLMPEDVLRFLDCSLGRELTPTEMTHYFPVSLTAAKRRRYSLPSDGTAPTPEGIELVRRLFGSSYGSETASSHLII